LRCRYIFSAVGITLLCTLATADTTTDLPAATHGFDAWTSVVAKAMSFGGKDQAGSLQELSSFQEKVMASFKKQVRLILMHRVLSQCARTDNEPSLLIAVKETPSRTVGKATVRQIAVQTIIMHMLRYICLHMLYILTDTIMWPC
jgi:hypothetical protein